MGQLKINSAGEQLCQLQKEADEIAFELQSEPPFYHFDVESNCLVEHKLSDCAEKLYNNSQKCFVHLCKFHSFAPKLLAKYQTSELEHIAENFITNQNSVKPNEWLTVWGEILGIKYHIDDKNSVNSSCLSEVAEFCKLLAVHDKKKNTKFAPKFNTSLFLMQYHWACICLMDELSTLAIELLQSTYAQNDNYVKLHLLRNCLQSFKLQFFKSAAAQGGYIITGESKIETYDEEDAPFPGTSGNLSIEFSPATVISPEYIYEEIIDKLSSVYTPVRCTFIAGQDTWRWNIPFLKSQSRNFDSLFKDIWNCNDGTNRSNPDLEPKAVWSIKTEKISRNTFKLEKLQHDLSNLIADLPSKYRGLANGIKGIVKLTKSQNVHWILIKKINDLDDELQNELAKCEKTQAASKSKYVFRKKGNMWEVVFNSGAIYIKDYDGMTYLAYLLNTPNKKISSMDLYRHINPPDLSSTRHMETFDNNQRLSKRQEVMPMNALKDLNKRMQEINADIEAAKNQNPVEVSVLEKEKDEILEQIRKIKPFFGKKKMFTDEQEKARKAVGKAIKDALLKIKPQNPDLYNYMEKSIKKGNKCSYEPDSDLGWVL